MPVPASIELLDTSVLRIVWDDKGAVATDYPARELRLGCRCAACVSETTGARLLDPDNVAAGISVTGVELTGNYGIAVSFDDGHGTGIYSWEYLIGAISDAELAARIRALA